MPVNNRDTRMNRPRSLEEARGTWRRIGPLIALCVAVLPAHAEETQHDFLLFPSVDTFDTFDESRDDVSDSFVRPSLNVLYSYNLSLIHISEPTRQYCQSRMPSSA